MITATEIMKILRVSQAAAYRIIRQLNEILEKDGYLTVRGKTSKKLFKEKFYIEEMEEM